MECATLSELPPSPAGKIGWPWTEQSQPLPDRMPDGSEWPRISIVTPSYNQGEYIEETIRSVLLQSYPNLEYIIIDGGSTDNTVEIIKKYQKYIACWVSESDRGQSHAINKGFARSTGDILCWLNSDDLLKPQALEFVAQALQDRSNPAWLVGASEIIDEAGNLLSVREPGDIIHESILNWLDNWFPQQSSFWTRAMWETVGHLDETLNYIMDFALWLSMVKQARPITTKTRLSLYRYQKNAKCISKESCVWDELLIYLSKYVHEIQIQNGVILTKTEKNNLTKFLMHLGHLYCYHHQYSQAKKCMMLSIEWFPNLFKKIKYQKKLAKLIIKIILGKQGDRFAKMLKYYIYEKSEFTT